MGIAVEIAQGGGNDAILGFGKNVTGCGPNPATTYTITNSAATGAGSWDEVIPEYGATNCLIQFSVATVNIRISKYLGSNVTIDGLANGMNGVTFVQYMDIGKTVAFPGPCSNILVRGIRFQGYVEDWPQAPYDDEEDELSFDGLDGQAISNVAVDRCTFVGATDGACDLVGAISNVTIQRCLFYGSPMTMLIKYDTRSNFTIHGCIFTNGNERNPQIKGDIEPFEFVNNIVAFNDWPDWGVGLYIWRGNAGSDSVGIPSGNVKGCLFHSPSAFEFASEGDPDIYATGNTYSGGASAPSPLRGTPVSIPSGYEVTAVAYSELQAVVDACGAPNRTARDNEVIATIEALL